MKCDNHYIIFNDIFIRWLLVFGLAFFVFSPKNVFAVSIGSNECTNINNVMNTFSSNTSYILKHYKCYFNSSDDIEEGILLFYTDKFVNYSNNIFSVPGDSFKCVYYILEAYGGNRQGSLNQSSISATQIETGLVNGYDNPKSTCDILKVNIVSYTDGSDIYSDINFDINDINTYPVGHIEVIKPQGEQTVSYNDSYGAYPIDVLVKGKIPFDIQFGKESEFSKEEILKDLKKEMYNYMDYTLVDVGGDSGSFSRSDKTFLNDNDDKLVLFGNKSDWVTNQYITFEYSFKLYIKNKGSYRLNGFSFTSVPTYWNVGFLGLHGYDKFESFTAPDVEFSIGGYTDLNGDGFDDITGDIIPPDINSSDVDNGSWDSMSLVDKIEYIVTSIPKLISSLLSSFVSVISSFISLASSIATSGLGLGVIFDSVFSFLPEPIPQLIKVAFSFMVITAVVRWIRGA